MITLTTEQAQQIEVALKYARNVCISSNWSTDDTDEALSAIRAARAQEQAEQEPVAYVYEKDVAGIGMRKDVAFTKHVEVGTDLYAAPVQQVDLTDDEVDAFIDRAWDKQMSMPEIIRAVIAADREKNK